MTSNFFEVVFKPKTILNDLSFRTLLPWGRAARREAEGGGGRGRMGGEAWGGRRGGALLFLLHSML